MEPDYIDIDVATEYIPIFPISDSFVNLLITWAIVREWKQ